MSFSGGNQRDWVGGSVTSGSSPLLAGAYHLANFALPIAIMALLLLLSGIYPFGSQSFLTEDLKYQYIDFFSWFQMVLAGEGSIFYSAAQGLGANTWGLYSYYLASPFNLLVVFFDQEHLVDFVLVMVAAKLGCIQLATVFFLRRRFGLGRLAASVLALCFTWSSWTAAQLRNPMWLDMLILLPLVMWGVFCLVREKRWRLLVAALVASVVVCWYTAYMTFLFAFLYLVLEFLVARGEQGAERFGARAFAGAFARFAAVCAGALALSAFTFVPTVAAMVQTAGEESARVSLSDIAGALVQVASAHPVWALAAAAVGVGFVAALVLFLRSARLADSVKVGVVFALFCVLVALASAFVLSRGKMAFGCSLPLLLGGFFPNAPVGFGMADQSPQICAGMAVLLLAGLFAQDARIPSLVKASALFLVAFMVICAWVFPLYCVWCGFRVPSGFYCRIGQFVVMALVWVAAYAFAAASQRLRAGCGRDAEAGARTEGEAHDESGAYDAHGESDARSGGNGASDVPDACGVRRAPGRRGEARTHARSLVMTALALLACLAALFALGCYADLSDAAFACAAVVVEAVALGFALVGPAQAVRTASLLLVGAALVVEILGGSHFMWAQLYDGYEQADHDAYMSESRAQWEQIGQEEGAFRIAKTYTRSKAAALNEGMAVGYKELSSYSSAHDSAALTMLNALGYSKREEISTRYASPLLSSDALLGVRYAMTSGLAAGYEATDYPAASNGALVWRNPYALPLGYGVSFDALDVEVKSENPFELQNRLTNALVGREVSPYRACAARLVGEGVEKRWEVDVPAGMIGYAFVEASSQQRCYVAVDGAGYFKENDRFQDCVMALGDVCAEDATYEVVLTADPSGAGSIALDESTTCVFYCLDVSLLESVCDELAAQPFEATSFEDGCIEGTFLLGESAAGEGAGGVLLAAGEGAAADGGGVGGGDAGAAGDNAATGVASDAASEGAGGAAVDGAAGNGAAAGQAGGAASDGLLMMSIPNDPGWTVEVNGKRVDTYGIAGGALMGIPVAAGENHVVMRYLSPGVLEGCVLSATSAAVLCVGLFLRAVRRRAARKEGSVQPGA